MEGQKITTCYSEKKYLFTENIGNFIADENGEEMNLINVYPEIHYQQIIGFGGAITEAAAFTILKMTPDVQKQIMKSYFSPEGLGYNFCRLHINSCDFSLGNYDYLNMEKDEELKNFSIDKDEEYILPVVREALQQNDKILFLASPWSPPAFMKTNKEMNNGGKLLPEYYGLWAKYLVRYISEMKKKGINIFAITPQNEPKAAQVWDSCVYSTEEEQQFVRDYLGPELIKNGLSDVKIVIWDHNKERVFERTREICSDQKASNYVWGVGFHWYSGDHFENLSLVKEQFPDKNLIFTEGCVEYSRFSDAGSVSKAQMYAHDMIGNLNHFMSGFLDWNIVLDSKGGPNHVGNFCEAPIMCDIESGTFEKKLSFYYIAHFSRYITRGSYRIAVSCYTNELEVTAFLRPDGKTVLVILNPTGESRPAIIRQNGMLLKNEISANSITTFVYGE